MDLTAPELTSSTSVAARYKHASLRCSVRQVADANWRVSQIIMLVSFETADFGLAS